MTTSEIATVLAWHDALNEQDFDTLVALSSDDIDVGDSSGAVQGHAALVEWAGSAGIKVEPGRMYVHDGVVVVESLDIVADLVCAESIVVGISTGQCERRWADVANTIRDAGDGHREGPGTDRTSVVAPLVAGHDVVTGVRCCRIACNVGRRCAHVDNQVIIDIHV